MQSNPQNNLALPLLPYEVLFTIFDYSKPAALYSLAYTSTELHHAISQYLSVNKRFCFSDKSNTDSPTPNEILTSLRAQVELAAYQKTFAYRLGHISNLDLIKKSVSLFIGSLTFDVLSSFALQKFGLNQKNKELKSSLVLSTFSALHFSIFAQAHKKKLAKLNKKADAISVKRKEYSLKILLTG